MVTFGYKNHIIVYSIDKQHPILVAIERRYWKILGKCSKCGECCKDCEDLIKESVNDIIQHVCKKQWRKPVDCALFPCTPSKENTPNCTFSYQEVSKENFVKELWSVI